MPHIADVARAASQVLDTARANNLPARYIAFSAEGEINLQVDSLDQVEQWARFLGTEVKHSGNESADFYRVHADLWEQPIEVYTVDYKVKPRSAA